MIGGIYLNKYAQEILKEIKKQSKKSKVSMLRIEGIDSPIIYKYICDSLKSFCFIIMEF